MDDNMQGLCFFSKYYVRFCLLLVYEKMCTKAIYQSQNFFKLQFILKCKPGMHTTIT